MLDNKFLSTGVNLEVYVCCVISCIFLSTVIQAYNAHSLPKIILNQITTLIPMIRNMALTVFINYNIA